MSTSAFRLASRLKIAIQNIYGHFYPVPGYEPRDIGQWLSLCDDDLCWEVMIVQQDRRSHVERRTGKDRRRIFSFKGLTFRRKDRRVSSERRSGTEMRESWVRVSKWSSASLEHLKISKYLLGKTNLTKNNPYS
jgi:hypothetical protein